MFKKLIKNRIEKRKLKKIGKLAENLRKTMSSNNDEDKLGKEIEKFKDILKKFIPGKMTPGRRIALDIQLSQLEYSLHLQQYKDESEKSRTYMDRIRESFIDDIDKKRNTIGLSNVDEDVLKQITESFYTLYHQLNYKKVELYDMLQAVIFQKSSDNNIGSLVNPNLVKGYLKTMNFQGNTDENL